MGHFDTAGLPAGAPAEGAISAGNPSLDCVTPPFFVSAPGGGTGYAQLGSHP